MLAHFQGAAHKKYGFFALGDKKLNIMLYKYLYTIYYFKFDFWLGLGRKIFFCDFSKKVGSQVLHFQILDV